MKIHRSASNTDGHRYRNEMLQDDRLSLPALGLLVWLLSRPDDWTGTADEISLDARQKRGDKRGEGRRAIRALFAELEQTGYLVRTRTHDTQGRFVTVLEVHDTPQPVGDIAPRDNTTKFPRGDYVYRHWDGGGRLLYVGVAKRPAQRELQHAKTSPWMTFHARTTFERFDTRPEALAAEAAAIENERPIFNVAGNDTPDARRRLIEYLAAQGRPDLLASVAVGG